MNISEEGKINKRTIQLDFNLIEIDELVDKKDSVKIIVFGTLEYGRRIKKALERFGISVLCYADNNMQKQGNILDGLKIISPVEILEIENPLVIVGSFWFSAITEQLHQLGIKNVFALLECPVNSYAEIMEDRKELEKYFLHYAENISDKILVEVYGHIGDVLIKTGVCKILIAEFGKENVYFLVDNTENRNIEQYIGLLSNNVLNIEMERFSMDRQYRLEILQFLNSQYFKFSYNLNDMRFHLKMRYMNKYILNVGRIFFEPNGYYVVDKDYKMLHEILEKDVTALCEENNNIVAEIERIRVNTELPEEFIVISMGAANKLRCYDVEKFRMVLKYLIRQNYNIVLLGYGTADEKYYEELLRGMKDKERIINLTTKLSLVESLAVIGRCQFFVGVDSGMWNGSYILKRKSVVIYGKGDWGNFMHNSENIYYVTRKERRCTHCKYWDCRDTIDGRAPCVDGVKPVDIILAIQQLEASL